MTPEEKQAQIDKFMQYLPDTLYFNHYNLNMEFPQWSAEQWRQFLRDHDKFIMKEVAAITEAEARKALQKLSTGSLSSQEVTAIKQILDRSEQINKTNQDSRTFVTTFMPNIAIPPPEPIDKALLERQIYADNRQHVKAIYFPDDYDTIAQRRYYERVQNGEIIQNEDGTITIPRPTTETDMFYLDSKPQSKTEV